MRIEHQGKAPVVHDSAWVAPNAVLCGDVRLGAECRVSFGAVINAGGGTVEIGGHGLVMEQAVIRANPRHATRLGDHVLVGPHAHLTGCTVEDYVFVGTGAAIFNLAVLEEGAEVRIHGVVHVASRLTAGAVVPIGWVAVGDPAEILPPEEHDAIWAVQEGLDFPGKVFGLKRGPPEQMMPEMTRRYAAALGRHRNDRLLDG